MRKFEGIDLAALLLAFIQFALSVAMEFWKLVVPGIWNVLIAATVGVLVFLALQHKPEAAPK